MVNIEAFGQYFVRLPLTKSPFIYICNSLTTPWNDVVSSSNIDYILGNPPFGGSKYQSNIQRAEIRSIAKGINSCGTRTQAGATTINFVRCVIIMFSL